MHGAPRTPVQKLPEPSRYALGNRQGSTRTCDVRATGGGVEITAILSQFDMIRSVWFLLPLGLDTDMKALIRPFTTGEFDSPPKNLQAPYVRVEP
eukprot:20580-Pyramimonas_sp.AAC.1